MMDSITISDKITINSTKEMIRRICHHIQNNSRSTYWNGNCTNTNHSYGAPCRHESCYLSLVKENIEIKNNEYFINIGVQLYVSETATKLYKIELIKTNIDNQDEIVRLLTKIYIQGFNDIPKLVVPIINSKVIDYTSRFIELLNSVLISIIRKGNFIDYSCNLLDHISEFIYTGDGDFAIGSVDQYKITPYTIWHHPDYIIKDNIVYTTNIKYQIPVLGSYCFIGGGSIIQNGNIYGYIDPFVFKKQQERISTGNMTNIYTFNIYTGMSSYERKAMLTPTYPWPNITHIYKLGKDSLLDMSYRQAKSYDDDRYLSLILDEDKFDILYKKYHTSDKIIL